MPPRLAKGGVAAGLLLVMAGCVIHVGSRAEDVDAAWSGAGTAVHLGMPSGTVVEGELLAASDSGLLVRTATGLVLARYERVLTSTFGSPTVSLSCCRKPGGDALAALRLVSRYPQGIPAELQARLLALAAQPALVDAKE